MPRGTPDPNAYSQGYHDGFADAMTRVLAEIDDPELWKNTDGLPMVKGRALLDRLEAIESPTCQGERGKRHEDTQA